MDFSFVSEDAGLQRKQQSASGSGAQQQQPQPGNGGGSGGGPAAAIAVPSFREVQQADRQRAAVPNMFRPSGTTPIRPAQPQHHGQQLAAQANPFAFMGGPGGPAPPVQQPGQLRPPFQQQAQGRQQQQGQAQQAQGQWRPQGQAGAHPPRYASGPTIQQQQQQPLAYQQQQQQPPMYQQQQQQPPMYQQQQQHQQQPPFHHHQQQQPRPGFNQPMPAPGLQRGPAGGAPPPMQPQQPLPTNAIIASRRQQGNPVLKHIRNVRWQFADNVVPDFLLGAETACLFLSLRFHLLKPEYIHSRIKELQRSFRLRIILCHVDTEDAAEPLSQVTRAAIGNDCTLICGWSSQECARYLETFKSYENKPAEVIQKDLGTDYLSRINAALTTVRGVNRTDVKTLGDRFGSVAGVFKASAEELQACPGIGPTKARRLFETFHQPFRRSIAGAPSSTPPGTATRPAGAATGAAAGAAAGATAGAAAVQGGASGAAQRPSHQQQQGADSAAAAAAAAAGPAAGEEQGEEQGGGVLSPGLQAVLLGDGGEEGGGLGGDDSEDEEDFL